MADHLFRSSFGATAGAALLLAAAAPAALAQATAAISVAPESAVTFVGEANLAELSNASVAHGGAVSVVAQRPHRLPNGQTTREAAAEAATHLPAVKANAAVRLGPATFSSVSTFQGIYAKQNGVWGGSEVEPPDQGLAVNNNVVVETVNNLMRVFDATTGKPLTNPISMPKFLKAGTLPIVSDPQVFFDPSVQRWFITELLSDYGTATGAVEQIAVAVSKTADPVNGGFYIYKMRTVSNDLAACNGVDCLPDYPKVGYDANGLFISVNLFGTCNSCNFAAAATYVLPKAKLVAGTGGAIKATRVVYPSDFVVQPSIPAPGDGFVGAANGTEYLMEARKVWDGSDKIRVWAISNTATLNTATPALRVSHVDLATQAYAAAVAAKQPDVVGPYCSSQGFTSAPNLDGGYGDFGATIKKAGGKLYGALSFGATDGGGLSRNIVAWFAVKPSVTSTGKVSATIAAQGYLAPPDGYSLLYPAFALNKSGAGALGVTVVNNLTDPATRLFPSTGYIQVLTGGTPDTTISLGKVGIAADDGFTGCDSSNPTARDGRWGDYGAAAIDAKTGYFYTVNENVSGPAGSYSNWGTSITRLH